ESCNSPNCPPGNQIRTIYLRPPSLAPEELSLLFSISTHYNSPSFSQCHTTNRSFTAKCGVLLCRPPSSGQNRDRINPHATGL
ncbi:hypothetical protein CEXT_137151, partial [Caerostris extrusa]